MTTGPAMTSSIPLSITLGYVLIAMAIGLHARRGRRMDSLEEWGVAGRSMGPVTPGAGGDMSFRFWTTSVIVSMFSFMPPVWTQWMSAASAATIRRSATWLPSYYLVILPMGMVGFIGIYTLPDLARSDTVVLEYAMQNLPAVLVGLLGAGTLAASMSSCEPFIHSVALSYGKDVIQPLCKLSDAAAARLARWLIVPLMALIIAPLAIAEPGSLVMILLVGLGFATQVLPAFIGMFLWPRASRAGVIAGIVAGFVITTAFTTLWTHPLGIHAGFWGLAINLPVFVAVSLATRPVDAAVTERFLRIAAPRWYRRHGQRAIRTHGG